MTFINGKAIAYDTCEIPHFLPFPMFQNVQESVYALHKQGSVFGDVRPHKIIIANGNAMLINFDWCLMDGVGRYRKPE